MNNRWGGARSLRRRTLLAGLNRLQPVILAWLMPAAMAMAATSTDASVAPKLELRKHDRVALVGGALAERMNRGGHFESLLHARSRLSN